MKPDISLFLAGIRQDNWNRLYDSIERHIGQHSFELVICGPYRPNDGLMAKGNVVHIESWRCPTACYQQAALACKSDLISYLSDDGWLLPGWEQIIAQMKSSNNVRDVIIAKYVEGGKHYPDASYYLHFHDAVRWNTYSDKTLLFNLPIMWKDNFVDCGGFDAISFPSHAMAFADIGVRMTKVSNVIFKPTEILEVEQIEGTHPEHLPIHIQQTQFDEKKYKEIYSNPESVNRLKIDIDNWKNTEEKWTRRFN